VNNLAVIGLFYAIGVSSICRRAFRLAVAPVFSFATRCQATHDSIPSFPAIAPGVAVLALYP